jgi:hypothetical protein
MRTKKEGQMRKKQEGKPNPPSANKEALEALFAAEHHPSHNQKWSRLRSDIARDALIKAHSLSERGIDPGDAYLQGIADLYYRLERDRLVDEIVQCFDPDAELSSLSDDSKTD